MNPEPSNRETRTAIPAALNSGQAECGFGEALLLACVETDLLPVQKQLATLCAKYQDGGESRIAWEILQASRALEEAKRLAAIYLSGKPLPTLDEIREIYKQANDQAQALRLKSKP